MNVQEIINSEVRWLARREGAVLSEMMDVYQGTLDEIYGTINGLKKDSYSQRHARAIQAQLEHYVSQMQQKQSVILGKQVSSTFRDQISREKNTLVKLEKTFGDQGVAEQFSNFFPAVPQRTIEKLLLTQGISIKGLSDVVIQDVRKLGVARSLTMGEGTRLTIKRLEKMGLPIRKGRLHLISRMEVARSSNEGKTELLTQVSEEFSDMDFYQMVREYLEYKADTRNHWFSYALNNTVRSVTQGEYFEVHHDGIAAAKAEYFRLTGRRATGSLLFELFEKGYRGKTLPAHFWGREVAIAWRPSWGANLGRIKHPQGTISGVRRELPDVSFSEDIEHDENRNQPPKPISRPQKKKSENSVPVEQKTADDILKDVSSQVKEARQIENAQKSLKYKIKIKRMAGKDISDEIIEMRKLRVQKNSLNDVVREALKADSKASFKVNITAAADDAPLRRELEEGVDFARSIFGAGNLDNKSIDAVPGKKKRATYRPSERKIYIRRNPKKSEHVSTMAHELAHWIEHTEPEVLKNSVEFWKRRTKNDKLETLRSLYKDSDFEPHEKTKKDNFMSAYMGKVYYKNKRPEGVSWQEPYNEPFDGKPQPPDKISGTELISKGVGLLYQNPLELILRDEDYFRFLWRAIRNAQR